MDIVTAENCCEEIRLVFDAGQYPRFFPKYHNVNVVEAKWKIKLLEMWRSSEACYPAMHIFRLKNVRMFDVGYLVKDEQIVYESIQHLAEHHVQSIRLLLNNLKSNQFEDIDSTVFLLKRRSSTNYGHWLVEFLPWIGCFHDVKYLDTSIIIERVSNSSFLNLQLQTIDAFNVDRSKIIRCARNNYILNDAWIPSKSCIHSHTKHPELIKASRDAAFRCYLPKRLEMRYSSRGRCLFISRKSHNKRRLLNEEEIKAYLDKLGFELIYPEDLSFQDQISTFSTADVIVGVSGASLTNILFCSSKCKVISLNSNSGPEYFFWDIACILGLDYSFVFGNAIDSSNPHSDFNIEIEYLREALIANSITC
jgi:capsular polysaccharide biosynthesis protein